MSEENSRLIKVDHLIRGGGEREETVQQNYWAVSDAATEAADTDATDADDAAATDAAATDATV